MSAPLRLADVGWIPLIFIDYTQSSELSL
jgi:hypothetical protein